MVVAPALDFAARQQGARVGPAQSDARRRRDRRHVDGDSPSMRKARSEKTGV